jgi:hypothetical protein
LPSGKAVKVSTFVLQFDSWQGAPVETTHGLKPVIDFDGTPLFAERAIWRLLRVGGWEGPWVDSWRKAFRNCMRPRCCDLPQHAETLLNRVNSGQRWCAGCPDLLTWRGEKYLFTEAKWRGRDKIGKKQKAWLESALDSELALESFVRFEWGFRRPN